LAGDDLRTRLRDLHQRAKRGGLTPDEQAEYVEAKDTLSRALGAAQDARLEHGQVPRGSFRAAMVLKVEVTFDEGSHKTATMDVSTGGFSALLGISPSVGTEATFQMSLKGKETLGGTVTVAGAVKERSLNRLSFAFKNLSGENAARLEDALLDAVLGREGTPPVAFVPPGLPKTPTPHGALVDLPRPPPPASGRERVASQPSMPTAPSSSLRRATPPADSAAAVAVPARARPAAPSVPEDAALVAPPSLAPSAPSRRQHALFAGGAIAGILIVFLGVALLRRGGESTDNAVPTGVALAPPRAYEPPPPPPSPVVAETPPAAPASAAPAPSAPPAPAAPAPVAAAAATPATPSDVGTIKVTVPGHRVFLDGKLAGNGAQSLVVACGAHKVKVGSSRPEQAVDVPCGGEIVVAKP
jgi:hypothetical protein